MIVLMRSWLKHYSMPVVNLESPLNIAHAGEVTSGILIASKMQELNLKPKVHQPLQLPSNCIACTRFQTLSGVLA